MSYEIKADFAELISAKIGTITILENYNNTRPSTPYLGINITSESDICTQIPERTDGAGIREIKKDMEWMVTINGYGEEAYPLLQNLKNYFDMYQSIKELDDIGLVNIGLFTTITPTPTNLDGVKLESRWFMEYKFRLHTTLTENVGFIDKVEVDNEIIE